jgi:hypothetical protein
MTAETKPRIRAAYDEKAFRIHIVSDGQQITEISLTDILLLAEKSGLPTGPLGAFADGPLTASLQNLPLTATHDFTKVSEDPLKKILTQALKKVDAKAWQGAPNYTGPAAQAYE